MFVWKRLRDKMSGYKDRIVAWKHRNIPIPWLMCVKIRDSGWTHFIYAMLIALGPALLGWAKLAPTAAEIQNGKEAWPFTRALADFFVKHPNLTVACYFLPLVAIPMKGIGKWFDKRVKIYEHFSGDGVLKLLRIFQGVVANKAEALGVRSKPITWDGASAIMMVNALRDNHREQVSQMRELMVGLYTIFTHMVGETDAALKVTLVAIHNDTIQDFVYFLPKESGPISIPEKLRHKTSGFSTAARDRKLLIVENVRREINRGQNKPERRRFWAEEPRDGALLCYPVYDRNLARVVIAISVFADKNSVFKEAERKKYEYVLHQFEKRLLVEYNNLMLELFSSKTTATKIT